MKVSSYAVGRPAYYDRTATRTAARFANPFTAPHAQTTRWTVTIASGKKAFMETCIASIVVDASPTTGGFQRIQVGTSDGTTFSDVLLISQYTTTTTKPILFNSTPTQLTLYASQTLTAFTQDSSVGGTAEYTVSTQCTVFDA
jgi:hypothetical protein